ncbi:MAG TPA: prepilin-type N-terminal cleavage/methylation domain-containing protein [Thermodesulfovibrionia bacterium]|nr:prepilin-type N-terminal cleavage/methylation domain-containing protein [Thermodesulfovibrionia bacterium]
MKNAKGFTLVEILIVIAIIGILAAIGVPTYIGMQKRAARSEAFANLESLRLMEEQYLAEKGIYRPNPVGTENYEAKPGDGKGIEDLFPSFMPGGCRQDKDKDCGKPYGLQFTYSLQTGQEITDTSNQPPSLGVNAGCFVATARGAGLKVPNVPEEVYMIDCNNTKNF